MEIKPEFESELQMWNVREFVMDRRKFDECIPENLKEGREYAFLLEGQKFFALFPKFPLVEKPEDPKGSSITRGLANLIEVTHFVDNDKVFTKGRYRIIRVISE